MEDNEFEEVTIISHTDLCSSVLPQTTAERLMKEVRLEVTQKISPTENVKLGTLQDPEAERRMNKIQEHLAKNVTAAESNFYMFHHSVIWEQGFWLLTNNGIIATVPQTINQVCTNDRKFKSTCYFVIEIGRMVLLFFHMDRVRIVDSQTEQVSTLNVASKVDLADEPVVVSDWIFFKSDQNSVGYIKVNSNCTFEAGHLKDADAISLVWAHRLSKIPIFVDIKKRMFYHSKENSGLALSKTLEGFQIQKC